MVDILRYLDQEENPIHILGKTAKGLEIDLHRVQDRAKGNMLFRILMPSI